jgi:hypothetical protein
MSRHKLFRGHAAECLRLAERVKSDELWSILITMAHAWHRLAQQWDLKEDLQR